MKKILFLSLALRAWGALAQPAAYTTANLHSHNDYEQPIPFYAAYHAGFGSIEADIFLHNGQLLVAHTDKELSAGRTLEKLYLQPLQALGSKVHPVQMMIDIKTDSVQTLNKLVEVLQQYPSLIQNKDITWVISGNRPAVSAYNNYPSFISFDGELHKTYPAEVLPKIAMLSGPLQAVTKWNGKGVLEEMDKNKVQQLIDKGHQLHKTVRFWAAPDVVNAWYQLMHLGVDFINTDNIEGAASFLQHLPASSYTATQQHAAYTPAFTTDGSHKKAKNIILIIGDGTGLAQWYTGYTANKGQLSVFNIRNTGLSKTSSHDSYITDSAPGSTAFASGVKTNNRFVGVDHTGQALTLLPAIISRKKMLTGIVTSGDITDATPADFYAHRNERENSNGILQDLATAPVQLLMGAGNKQLAANAANLQQHGYHITRSLDSLPAQTSQRYIVADSIAGLSILKGRGNWLSNAFDKATTLLKQQNNGYLLVLEGAQVDYGGHANHIGYIAEEVMDLDKVITKALQLADADKETLVIITADHETGGLSLLDGDISKGYISGHFSTNDHTAIPVPVYAYGPQSQLFTGVYENTEVFRKILQSLGF
ncbi:alkaline phosphatase [Filimonas lacunae]|uniref:Alkaline phosphatase n=1 Tax=Filimonas lacunae TaxID=477680 RepID=A0A173MJV4_9BACT|nr:alkaline phosphatase [Filimonas lacunae]BAV07780.1 alkaline phosphatase [Filimonas lacunae]SIT04674.1 alkaline phosphatase [Filimonas lacunae]